MSEELVGHRKKDCVETLFINFFEEITQTWIDTLFSTYFAIKLLFEVSLSVVNKLILSFCHNFMICSQR